MCSPLRVSALSSTFRNTTGHFLSPLIFNIVLLVLARDIRKGNETKHTKIRNENVKLPHFGNDMMLYIENPKASTRQQIEIINDYSKVAGYKINVRKYIEFYKQ